MSNKTRSTRRLFILGAIKTSAIFCLVSRLCYLQVVKNQQYKALSDHNRLKVSLANATRGNILDRNGTKIAYNEKQYNLIFEPVKGIDVEYSVSKLLNILRIPQSEYHSLYTLIKNAKEATIIIEDMDWEVVRSIEFNLVDLHGIFIITNYKRCYPMGLELAHIIGYVRKNYRNGLYSYVGESGVEYTYNDDLEGNPGILQEEVNAKMQVIRSLSRIASTSGKDIKLSINCELQNFIYGVLGKIGSVVVIDVGNGNILSMNNYPSYDNNLFVKSISQKQWETLLSDKGLPLFNRAVALQIPPGSTFKMIAALAALEHGIIETDTSFFCNGEIRIGNNIFRCWKRHGHGNISLNEAISSSCNVYFYHIGQRMNVDHLLDVAKKFGLGKLPGTRLREEMGGIIPDREWRKKNNKNWYLGDTINSVIGHGYVLVTPLQLAVMTARLATGKRVTPSIINTEQDFTPLDINNHILYPVRYGMYSAVNSFGGTANKVYSTFQSIAGKTGTSQVKSMVNGNKIDENHSLFVGYAPYDKPEYAISVVMERSPAGTASKIAKKVLDYLFMHGI